MGGQATGGSRGFTRTSGGSCSARPNVSNLHCLHSINGSASACTITTARVYPGAIACIQHDVGDSESNGLPIATRGQSETQKKLPETNAIFANIKAKDHGSNNATVKRLSIDCKATVHIGDYSRGGQTRGNHQAIDHDMGCEQKYIPCGIVDEDSGQLYIHFGSSYKTSDFIVDTLQDWWKGLTPPQQRQTELLQLKVDNGPESSGVRTQFLKRMVEFSDRIGKSIQLLYYPPYHSKYNPIE
jgi:Rhodopirellula transposase DDE domain